jgi:Skp family chaperone for outer membrane proteins
MFDFLSVVLGFGLGLIFFSGSWLLFQWPNTRKMLMENQDRKDLIKKNNELRQWRENARADIVDRDRRLASMDSALAQANKEADRYQAMAKAAKEALQKEGSKYADIIQIMNLADQGKSLNEIQNAVFGYTGGHAYKTVKDVLGTNGNGDTF